MTAAPRPQTNGDLTWLSFDQINENPPDERLVPLGSGGWITEHAELSEPPEQVLRVILEGGVYKDINDISLGPHPIDGREASRGPIELVGVPGETVVENAGVDIWGSTVRVSGIHFRNTSGRRAFIVDAIESLTLEDVVLEGYGMVSEDRVRTASLQTSGPDAVLTIRQSIIRDSTKITVSKNGDIHNADFRRINIKDSWFVDTASPAVALVVGRIVELDNVRVVSEEDEPVILKRSAPDTLILGDPVRADRGQLPVKTIDIPR